MSLFPRFQEISPVFRLLDEYDRVARHAFQAPALQSFTPKFDVKEHQEHYELTGELPGIENQDIKIEWTDGNTLSINGRTEHRSQSGTPPAVNEDKPADEPIASNEESIQSEKQATVEDAADDDLVNVSKPDESQTDTTAALTPASTATATEVSKPAEKKQPKPRYWVSERSVGEFHRTFSFPARVDQDAVKASLKNGILNIVVPKAKAKEPRRINIE